MTVNNVPEASLRATHDDLSGAIEARSFWRLVPDRMPREFAEPTTELKVQVERGLRRLIRDE